MGFPPTPVKLFRQLLIMMLSRGSPSSEKTKLEPETKENEVVVVAFYGTSCMGKSELVAFIRDQAKIDGSFVQDVSKDTVARPMMDAYHKEHPELPYEDIYMTIYGNVVQKFIEDSFRALRSLQPGKNIVFLDDAWANEKLLERIATEDVCPGFNKRVICVYPKISEKVNYSNLPFSLQFIVNLLYRVVIRKEHQTLVYDDVKKIQIVISFLKLYSNISNIQERFKDELPIDEFYSLEFHQESDISHEDDRMPESLREVFKQIEACFEKMGAPFESPLVTGKEEFEKLTKQVNSLIDNKAHQTMTNFINFGRKSEWEKWYKTLFSN